MSKSYCAKLWNHQYVHMNGNLKFCCATKDNLTDENGNALNVETHSLEQTWNNDAMKKTRLKMINGEPVSACIKCVQQEARGYSSSRETDNETASFSATHPDGSIDLKPRSMELHLGNVCNLRCKMCSQEYSNQIGKELLEIGKTDNDFLDWVKKESGNVNNHTHDLSVEYKWFQNADVKQKLFEHILRNVDDIVVIGGEPTVIPEFWELFAYLDSHNRLKDISITLPTNLTNVNPRMTDWFPKLKSWMIWASVDGLGKRTEYIRYPSNFDKVCKNLDFYKNMLAYKNGSIVLSPAIQLLNIDQLDDILKWWLEYANQNLIPDSPYGVSWMAQVWYPTICNYDILPSEYKEKIATKLEKSSHLFSGFKDIHNWYESQIQNLRHEVYTEQQKKYFQEAFIRYNDTQDRHRKGLTWRQLLPDLEKALTESLTQSKITK